MALSPWLRRGIGSAMWGKLWRLAGQRTGQMWPQQRPLQSRRPQQRPLQLRLPHQRPLRLRLPLRLPHQRPLQLRLPQGIGRRPPVLQASGGQMLPKCSHFPEVSRKFPGRFPEGHVQFVIGGGHHHVCNINYPGPQGDRATRRTQSGTACLRIRCICGSTLLRIGACRLPTSRLATCGTAVIARRLRHVCKHVPACK